MFLKQKSNAISININIKKKNLFLLFFTVQCPFGINMIHFTADIRGRCIKNCLIIIHKSEFYDSTH